MEKRLSLDQFKKNVGTQQVDLQKLTGGILGACHPGSGHTPSKTDSAVAQGIINGYNKLKDAFGL